MTNLQNLRFGKFGASMFFAALLISTTCFLAFLIVASLSSEMKMKRVTALPIVAIMQNFLTLGDWSVIELPRNAMRCFARTPVPYTPISVLIKRTIPQPASVVNQHMRLESLFQGFARRFDDLWKATKTTVAASTRKMASRVISPIRIKVEMGQTNAKWIVALVTNIKSTSGSVGVIPNPASGINVFKSGTASVVGASGPHFARAKMGFQDGSVRINVLVESDDGVYERCRHNGSFVVFSGARFVTGESSVATISNLVRKAS